jgi:hypothetical protein
MTKITSSAGKAIADALREHNAAVDAREAAAERERNHREHEAYLVEEHIAAHGVRGYKEEM